MEVYQIKVFLEVARHLSFTAASDTLNLTQPAVSAKIKSLETEIGTSLFYRSGKRVQLTEVGQFLFKEGQKLIEIENQLRHKIEEIKQGKNSQIKIGCTASISEGWVPPLIFQYRQKYPDIQIQCSIFESAESLYRAIIDNKIDVGISELSFAEFTEISATAIASFQYSLILTAKHPLAKNKWLSLKDLQKYAWVVLPPDTPNRLVLESRLTELGISLADFSKVETVDTPSLMRTYLTQGNFLGFASSFDFKAERQSNLLVSISLQEFPLESNVFLLLPQQLSQSVLSNSDMSCGKLRQHTNRKSRSLNPIEKFVALIQSTANSSNSVSLESHQASPIRLKSPNFIVHSNNSQRPNTIVLNLGVQNATIPTVTGGLVIQRLGLLEHFLPREGRYSSTQYKINWHDFPLGAPIIRGLQSGQLDIGLLGDYPSLLSAIASDDAADRQTKTRLVSFVSANPDGSCNAVIVPHKSKLHSLEDLRGRVIAVPGCSSAHGMVMRSLNTANLLAEVEIAIFDGSNLNYPNQLADGYAHFAPFHAIACRQGKFRYLLSDDLSGLPAFHAVLASEILADQYPEIVIAYLKALKAAQYWCMTTSSALSLIGRWTNVDSEILSQILSSPDRKNQSQRFFPEMTIRTDWIAQHIVDLSSIPGNENMGSIDLNQWIQPEFLEKAHNSV
ncbi:MAG TPA: LysR substrate-binding domain-containing protein [Leptolyngbyaceae cyanobacterium]